MSGRVVGRPGRRLALVVFARDELAVPTQDGVSRRRGATPRCGGRGRLSTAPGALPGRGPRHAQRLQRRPGLQRVLGGTRGRGQVSAVEAAIHEGLTFPFNDNGVTEPANVEVPAPIATRMQVWPDAWHWLAPGDERDQRERVRVVRRASPRRGGRAGRGGLQPAALGVERRGLQVLEPGVERALRMSL